MSLSRGNDRSFGVLLYELVTGVDLFQKDLNYDELVLQADRDALERWTGPDEQRLSELAFKAAVNAGTVSPERRLAALDLIMVRCSTIWNTLDLHCA